MKLDFGLQMVALLTYQPTKVKFERTLVVQSVQKYSLSPAT